MADSFWLTDKQMERLRPFFPKPRGQVRVDDRRVLSGIIFVNRNGLRWCDAPAAYGLPMALDNGWLLWSRRACSHGCCSSPPRLVRTTTQL
jgi:transposase